MLEIVKDVIGTVQAQNAAEAAKKDKAERKKKLLDAIAAQEDKDLSSKSAEELRTLLAELDS
jgi:hypothetical protein